MDVAIVLPTYPPAFPRHTTVSSGGNVKTVKTATSLRTEETMIGVLIPLI